MDLFDLYAKLTLDTKEYNKGLDDAEDKASKSGSEIASKFGSKVATAGKVAAAGIAAAGTAIVGITTKAVQAYGEFEQLTGGVEKLFGNSATIVENYAANAFKTAQMSANQYLDLSTSFSASLISALGGDTSAAAEMTDMAISDMADNWNMMGSNAEDVQNAYKGFAKKNYEMLDNLKLGYGGTASEMARLINDAGTLGRTVDESLEGVTFADIITAIHKVQEEMSITGTSSKEAATTIQGSIAMMKASWENFLTGLANPDADVGALADQLMESFEAVVTNIAPVAERVLTNLSNFFVNNGPQILEQLISLLNSLAPGLIQAVVTLLLAVAQALVDNIDLVADGLMQLVTGLFQILAQPGVLEGLLNAIITLLGYAANGIIEYGVPLFVKASTLLVEAIVNAFAGAGTWLLEAGFELIAGLMEGISEGLAPLANLLTSVTNMIPEWKGPPERDKNLLRGNGRLIMQSLTKGISDEEGNLEQTLGGVTNTIANGVGTGNVDYGDSAAGGLHNAIAASNRNDNSSPMTIIVQSVLDGRVIGETAYNYNRQIGRALGV